VESANAPGPYHSIVNQTSEAKPTTRPGASGDGAASTAADIRLEGVCQVLFAHDLALAIDLEEAERLIASAGPAPERQTLKHTRHAPASFEYRPAPLRVSEPAGSMRIGRFELAPDVDVVLFDFGAVSVRYNIPFAGSLDDLRDLSARLSQETSLVADSRRRTEDLLAAIGPAVSQPGPSEFVEDYAIFEIRRAMDVQGRPVTPEELLARETARLAGILRAESAALSTQETADALACRVSYAQSDAALIDWNAALVFDEDPEDVRSVLEFANVELLEMRHLDERLDSALDEAYAVLSKGSVGLLGGRGTDLRRIARLQVDSAVLFEGVNNALKLLGDQYLARVYRLAAGRLHLPEWDASILRKLQTLDSIYAKMSDRQATRRMEILEWIIILLIAFEVVMGFIRW